MLRHLVGLLSFGFLLPGAVAQHGVSPAWSAERSITDPAWNGSTGVSRMIAVDSLGVVHVLWQDGTSWVVHHSESADDGLTWSVPVAISTGSFPASGGNLAVAPDDVLHAAFIQIDSTSGLQHLMYVRRDPITGWEAPRDLSGAMAFDVAQPSISVDGLGRVHIAFHIGDPHSVADIAEVFYLRSTDGGASFSSPLLISHAGGRHAAWPRFSVSGTTHDVVGIAWRDLRNLTSWDIFVAVSVDGGATFTERPAATDALVDEWDPTLLVDPSGVLHLSYTFRSSPTVASIDYRRSSDLGSTWSLPTTLSSAPSFFSWWAYDTSNQVLWVLWKDERDASGGDRRSDLAARYSRDDGLSWSAEELVTDLGDTECEFPALAIGPDGAAYAVWSDHRAGATSAAARLKVRDWCPPSWQLYGPGHPGSAGIPSIALSADPLLGSTPDLTIGNPSGSTTTLFLFAGLDDAWLPVRDGVLLLAPLELHAIGMGPGGVALPISLPADASWCGADVRFQGLVLDPGASKGIAFTRGLRATLGW